ncbi:Type 1 glutamine amidotransferase-like domain-containing protein [Patescibacteria group bacterium]
MKLLLTSDGIRNKAISNALFELVGKKPEDTSLVFVPTASNMEGGDKTCLIDDLINLKNQNFKSIDIVDISAVDKDVWLPRFEEADILFFGGGNSYYLMEWFNKSGLTELLPELLKTKVYAGLSAGSMILGKELGLKISQVLYNEDLDRTEEMNGLGLIDFYFLAHLNSEFFPNIKDNLKEGKIKEIVKNMNEKVYALDDNSALKITDGKIEVVGEGKYLILNEK